MLHQHTRGIENWQIALYFWRQKTKEIIKFQSTLFQIAKSQDYIYISILGRFKNRIFITTDCTEIYPKGQDKWGHFSVFTLYQNITYFLPSPLPHSLHSPVIPWFPNFQEQALNLPSELDQKIYDLTNLVLVKHCCKSENKHFFW